MNRSIILILVIVMCFIFDTSAQDANYWTNQYGSRSTLLGGAVIGSVLDLSGTFYNPGGLSLIDDPDVLLAAKVFEYPDYILANPEVGRFDLTSAHFDLGPSIVATMFNFKWQGDHRLGISIFTRYNVKIDLSNTGVFTPDLNNFSNVLSDFRLYERLNETWFGLSWSYKLAPKVGIGVSQYITSRSHRAHIGLSTEAIGLNDEIYLLRSNKEYDYDIYQILWKIGIIFDFQGLTVGLTTTTPSIQFYSNGSSGLNYTYIGEDNNGDGNQDTWAAGNYQQDVEANFNTPISIGLGTTFKIEGIHFYFSAEWFSPVSNFNVINPVYFESQIGSDTLQNGVNFETAGVLNLGIGAQYFINENVSLNASFTTDYSARVPGTETNLSIASWDIFQVLAGTTFTIKQSKITLGVGYAFGKDSFNLSNLVFDPENNPLNGGKLDNLDFKYQNFKLVFGFSI